MKIKKIIWTVREASTARQLNFDDVYYEGRFPSRETLEGIWENRTQRVDLTTLGRLLAAIPNSTIADLLREDVDEEVRG